VIEARMVRNEDERRIALAIRHRVFIVEQQVPAELETDEYDAEADHLIGLVDGAPLGAGRLVVEPDAQGHLGRLAVLAEARGSGLGVALVRAIEGRARERGLREIVLGAQVYAVGFYQRLGYAAYGEVFDDAGIPHRHMHKEL